MATMPRAREDLARRAHRAGARKLICVGARPAGPAGGMAKMFAAKAAEPTTTTTGAKREKKSKGRRIAASKDTICFEGISLLWLVHMAQGLESGMVARDVDLLVAKRDAAGIRKGDTILSSGYSLSGRRAGINGRTGKPVSMREQDVRYKHRREWTMQDVRAYVVPDALNADYLKPRCFVDTLRKGIQTGPERGGAFVIHTRDANFRDLIDAALTFFTATGEPLDAQYLWLDELCADSAAQKISTDYLALVRGAMMSFSYRLAFVESWTELPVLRRLWCLWESVSAFVAKSTRRNDDVVLGVLPISSFRADRVLLTLLYEGKAERLVDQLAARNLLEVATCKPDEAEHFCRSIDARIGEPSFTRAAREMVRLWILYSTQRILEAERVYTGGASGGFAQLAERAGALHGYCGSIRPGRRLFEEALAVREVLHGPASSAVVRTKRSLAAFEEGAGNMEEAQRLLSEALEIVRDFDPDGAPAASDVLQLEVELLCDLGGAFERDGAHALALENLEEALDQQQAVHGPKHVDCAPILRAIATVYASLGDDESAMDCIAVALDIYKPVAYQHEREVVEALDALARLQCRGGDHAGAAQNLRTSLSLLLRSRAEGEHDLAVAIVQRKLAAALLRAPGAGANEGSEVPALLDSALGTLESALGPDHLETRRCSRLLRAFAAANKDGTAAEPFVSLSTTETGAPMAASASTS